MLFIGIGAAAQIKSASLQASGLTCSLCSKAVKNALEAVPFVSTVQVDIKNQQYNLSFKEGSAVDFDALNKAVQNAGFSVASLKAVAAVPRQNLQKDEHVVLGGQTFHFLNAAGQTLDGDVTFMVVDKGFVPAATFKKYAALTRMTCVQTGRTANCCASNDATVGSRIYHAVI